MSKKREVILATIPESVMKKLRQDPEFIKKQNELREKFGLKKLKKVM